MAQIYYKAVCCVTTTAGCNVISHAHILKYGDVLKAESLRNR